MVGSRFTSEIATAFPPVQPLLFDPVALVQVQAERDTRALVKDDYNAGFTKSVIVRKYRRYIRFSRTYLSDIIHDGRLDKMAKIPTPARAGVWRSMSVPRRDLRENVVGKGVGNGAENPAICASVRFGAKPYIRSRCM